METPLWNHAMRLCAAATASLLVSVHCCASGIEDCVGEWLEGEGFSGTNGHVYAVTTWAPPGRATPLVIAGGWFQVAGDIVVSNIAAWDPVTSRWQDFGGGANNIVRALFVHDGDLFAGGLFTEIGGEEASHIARFDGENWRPVAGGTNATVNALASFNGDLIVGGSFTMAGTQQALRIARFDGESWHPIGDGFDAGVESIVVYDEPWVGDPLLIAGGRFAASGRNLTSYLAVFLNEEWIQLGPTLSGPGALTTVAALAVHEGELFVGGRFNQSGATQLRNIARLHLLNQWDSLNGGVSTPGFFDEVTDLITYDGNLIVTGDFSIAGGVEASHIARWDGASWHPLGAGMDGSHGGRSLTLLGDELIVGGVNFWVLGDVSAQHIARWDGASWNSLGVGGSLDLPVRDFTAYQGELVAGGGFRGAGGKVLHRIARRDATTGSWEPLGSGMNLGAVNAVVAFDGDLIAGGSFKKAGDVAALHIARWDGEQWNPMAKGFGTSFTAGGTVYSLLVHDGELFAGGQSMVGVSRWTGSSWEKIDDNLFQVNALASYNGLLIAGGGFTEANGASGNRITAWDGSTWMNLGVGTNNTVNALAVFQGDLYVGGHFTAAGDLAANFIARWDGSQWHDVGGGTSGVLRSLGVFDGQLIAGGNFDAAGDVEANFIAHWNGSTWGALCGGTNAQVWAVAEHEGSLVAGGDFTFVDGKHSSFFAQWTGPLAASCPEDLNDDGVVDVLDVLYLIHEIGFGPCPDGEACPGDLNGDGVVNGKDVSIIARAFGPCP